MWGTLEFKLLSDSLWKNLFNFDLGLELPTIPTNTDGIDINGKNFVVERVKVINSWDDAVVMKSSDQT